MSFEDLDGGSGNPLDDIDLDLDLFADEPAAVATEEPGIENGIVSDISVGIGEKIVTRMEQAAESMERGEAPGEVTVIRRETHMGSPSRRGKDVLYVDIETAPDWDRFDSFGIEKPSVATENETPRLMMPSAADTVAMTVDKLKELIARQNPDVDWLDHIAEEEAKGKARKGFLAEIKAGKDAKDSYGKFIKQLSVNPMFCRMVVFGYAVGNGEPVAIPCLSPTEEKICLEKFWQLAMQAETICGFNHRSFDLPVILVRSIIHGVSPSIQLDLRKYGSANVLDLMQILYGDNLSKTMGLKQTCELFGIEVGNDMDGSKVNELVENPSVENLDKLSAYGKSDVRITQKLHREKLAGYFCV